MDLSVQRIVDRGTPRGPGVARSLLCSLVFGLSLACTPPAEDGPPRQIDRLFLVTVDTLRADHLGAYGYPRDTSPFLDEMAARSVLFERAYAPMSTTVPSHTTLFTSLYPVQHRVLKNGRVLGQEYLTLAEILRARGFQTAGFVATDSQFGPAALDQGFETFEQADPDAESYRQADGTIDAALGWLETADPDRPFFLWVHLFDPHGPLIPPEAHRERFELRSRADLDRFLVFLIERHAALPRSFAHGVKRMLNEHVRYDAEIRFADTELRRLYESAGRLGLHDRSLWIFTGDHGQGMTRRPRLGHGRHIYQEQIHVPLILHASDDLFAPRRVPGVVELTDLLPTVSELVGASEALDAQAAPIQGASLLPLMRGAPAGAGRAALIQRRAYDSPPPGRERAVYELGEKFALVEREWKYLHRTIGTDELYHLDSDPYEGRNVIDEFPIKAREMRSALLARLKRLRASAGPEAASVEPSTLEKLEALGYVQ